MSSVSIRPQSKTVGVALSYATIVVNVLSTLIMTSIYLSFYGQDMYGLYQYIYSIAQYALVLDLGLSSVIVRHVGLYAVEGNHKGVENVLFYCLSLTVLSSIAIVIIGFLLYFNISFFLEDRPTVQYGISYILLVIMIAQLVLALFQHYFDGIIMSCERYMTIKGITLFRIVFKIVFIIILIKAGVNIVSIAVGDLIATTLCVLYSAFYSFSYLKLKPKYHFWDWGVLSEMSTLMFALMLQSIVGYANRAIDKVIIGKMLTNIEVTIYSLGLTIANFFDEVPTAIQSVFLPSATKLVANNVSGKDLTDFVIKPGRYQFVLCSGILCGIVLFGRDFIVLWAGEENLLSWAVCLLLIIPSIIPLIQNVCLSILTAKNKRAFRSYVYLGIAVINCIITIFLVKKIGMIGAPLSTSIALIIGNCIIMNIYYSKVIGIEVIRLFKSIFKGIAPCALLSFIICAPLTFWNIVSWPILLLKSIVFSFIFVFVIFKWGFNDTERDFVKNIFKRIHK